jgi:hypothetical protein
VQGAGCDSDHSNTKASVHEGVVKVLALEWRHATILACLAIEDEIDRKQGARENATSVQQTLSHISLRYGVVGSLLVSASERLLELGDILRRRYRRLCGSEQVRMLLEWRAVESAECEGLRFR